MRQPTRAPDQRRRETKFVVANHRAPIVRAWLRGRCRPDPWYPAALVSSIYFDTRDWRLLGENRNGDYLKLKARIRWYSDVETSAPGTEAFLEAKRKVGGRTDKVRIRSEFSGAELAGCDLSGERLAGITRTLRAEGLTLRDTLYPVLQISFLRRRFVEPTTGARVCVDWDIHAPRVNRRMLPRGTPRRLALAVFEVKSPDGELPRALHPLTALGCRKRSFSKYAACVTPARA